MWFEAVARGMPDGTSRRGALKRHGIDLDQRQIGAFYRNNEFKRLCKEARHR